MIWTYDELGPKDYETLGWYAFISFRPLTFLVRTYHHISKSIMTNTSRQLFTPWIWLFSNIHSLLNRSRGLSHRCSFCYNATFGALLSTVCALCAVVLDHHDRDEWITTEWGSWAWVKPRNLAAITLGFLTRYFLLHFIHFPVTIILNTQADHGISSLIHLALAINHIRPRLEIEKNVDKINALIYQITDQERSMPLLSNDDREWTTEELLALLDIDGADERTRRYVRFALKCIEEADGRCVEHVNIA